MTVTLTNTTRIVELDVEGTKVPGRVWEGTTEDGTKVVALITRIAAEAGADQTAFRRDLEECKPPSDMALLVFPSRMVV